MAVEPITGLTYQEANSLQTDVLQNEQLNYFAAWSNAVVQTVGDNSPPGSPTNGQRYVIGTSPSGAWSGKAKYLAVYRGGWQFYAPYEGARVTNLDDGKLYVYASGAWGEYTIPVSASGITLVNGPAPATPATGKTTLFTNASGVPHYVNDAGVDNELATTGALAASTGASLVGTAYSVTLADMIAARVIGGTDSNKRLMIVAGALRNMGSTGTPDWQWIADGSHRILGFGTPSVVGGKIRIPYDQTYGKVVSLVCAPDETMAMAGWTCGASVGASYADIDIGMRMTGSINMSTGAVTAFTAHAGGAITASVASDGVVTITHPSNGNMAGRMVCPRYTVGIPQQSFVAVSPISSTETKLIPYEQLAGYVAWNGTEFAVTTRCAGVSVSYDSGVVTVTHPSVNLSSGATLSSRSHGSVVAMADSFGSTTFTVNFRDWAGTLVSTPSSGYRFYFSRPEFFPASVKSKAEVEFDLGYGTVSASQTTLNGGNIWVIGVFEEA